MSWWEKKYTGLNSVSEIISSLRSFFTAAGWVESQYTASGPDSTQILLKTKDTHLGNNGILHIVVNGSDIEFHAYQPGYAAFADPNSFDSPDDTYLVGGANYDAAKDYFNSGYPQKLTYSVFPDGIWLFSDGNFFYAFKTSDKSAVYGGLLADRTLEFGFYLGASYNSGYNSTLIGGTIIKGNTTSFTSIEYAATYIGGNGTTSVFTNPMDGNPGRFVAKLWVYINSADHREMLEMPYFRLGVKGTYTDGDTVTVGATTYEFVYDNGYAAILVQQGTDPTE